jgi:hypothetical protein
MRLLILAVIAVSSIAAAQGEQQPTSIDIPAGAHLVFSAKGAGVQVYTCTNSHWVLKGPDAKLLDGHGKAIGTHFAGPTWRLNDGSEVKGKAIASRPSPDETSVAWLLLEAVPGSSSGRLASVAYIRRTDTQGGVASTDSCGSGELSVPYKATYSFYSKAAAAGQAPNWVPSSPVK